MSPNIKFGVSILKINCREVYKLANKIKTGNKYNLNDSSIKSMFKVLEYYKLLLEKEPYQRNSILDEYSDMNKKELEKYIKKLIKK